MARLGAKVSWSEASSIPKNSFRLEFFDETSPIPLFWAKFAVWCVRGQNCSGRKHSSILPQKCSRIRFSKKHVFGLNFYSKSHITYFHGQTDYMARLAAKVSRSEVSSILKNTFSVGIFWWNLPHTSFLGLIRYMVRSGAKLFRTKTLLNFASNALSNSFFQKTRFRFEFLY